MGPREEKAWDEEAKIRFSPPGFGSASFGLRLQRAQLADALEEALAFWDDAGISDGNAEHHDRLRAVLKEVDRG